MAVREEIQDLRRLLSSKTTQLYVPLAVAQIRKAQNSVTIAVSRLVQRAPLVRQVIVPGLNSVIIAELNCKEI